MDNLNVVWFGKYLQVVNTGFSYQVFNGDLCLTKKGFTTKREAILRAHELQDDLFD